MAQRVFSLHRLQSSAGWTTFHLAGRKSVLCQVFQQPVCQKVCRLQHGHHRSVQCTRPASKQYPWFSSGWGLFVVYHLPFSLHDSCLSRLSTISKMPKQLSSTNRCRQSCDSGLNFGSDPFCVVGLFEYILSLSCVVSSYCLKK